MRREVRPGVSAYLEVFLLIGVALGGSAMAWRWSARYAGTYSGASLSVEGASLRQGSYAAVERLEVVNTGTSAIASFSVTTSQAPGSVELCYSLLDPASQTVVAATCPSFSAGGGTLVISHSLSPGQGVVAELVMEGSAFTVGSSHLVTVTASNGAQQSASVVVVPA